MNADGVRPGQTLADRYVLEREIGRGGMATVFVAEDRRHRRPVAVKVMRPDLSMAVGTDRFLREIEIAARLQHPHILPLFDSGEQEGVLYYVMPFIEGESLQARLEREKQLPISDSTTIAREVASALAYAHERGVVHRDVKPGNILLSSGAAIVTDFGIARLFTASGDVSLTSTGVAVGTPSYMSPEQASADRIIDGRSDMYALGCTLYEMLAGAPPFVGSARSVAAQHVTVEPRPIRQLRPQVPTHVERALMTALAKTPGDRFGSCGEFANALLERAATATGTIHADAADSRIAPIAGAPRVGPLVSRMCNRWNQVNAFDAHFRVSQQTLPGMPRFYVVHGEEGEAHDSLVERLVATRVSLFAAESGGHERATVPSLRIPWPDSESVDVRKRDLVTSLFREVAPTYMGSELSATTFGRLGAVALSPIVVVRHDVRANAWDAGTDGLLRWYANEFWGSITPRAQSPLVLDFPKVSYPIRSRLRLSALLSPRGRSKADIQKALKSILLAPDAKCPALILNELSSVTADDVKDWFNQNGIYDSERKRHELAESIFKQAPARRMAEVEVALENIRIMFARQQWIEGGNTAW